MVRGKEKNMAGTASDFLVGRLYDWGVRRIYGYPGDGINGVMGALNRSGKIDFIQAQHEENAAFKGDPNLAGIVKQSANKWCSTLLSHSG